MRIRQIIILLMIGFAAQSQAALEYLRVAGVAHDSCNTPIVSCGYTLADYGLVEGQALYFDFVIDTELDDFFNPDTFSLDFFDAIYVEGTNVNGLTPFSQMVARTVLYPEGSETQIRNNDASLGLGTRLFDISGQNFIDLSIDTWEVGTAIDLYVLNTPAYGEFMNTSIADLQVVYRSSTPPPAVPLPASIWLLLCGLASLRLAKKKQVAG